jgi:hypothetical protein
MDTMTLAPATELSRDEAGSPARRWTGAAVAFSIAFVAGLIGLGFRAPLLLLGIPAATVAGWFLGPTVNAASGIGGLSVAMAVVTVGIADALVVLGGAVGSLTSSSTSGLDPLTAIAGAVFLWVVGLVVVGIPMLVITVPCGLAWAVVVRMLARRPR